MEAVEYVRNGTYTISAAAKKYGVPRTTITDYLRRKSDKVKKMGAPTMLTETEEKALVEYILYMSDRSLPLRRCDLRTVILVNAIINVTRFFPFFKNSKHISGL